VQSRLLLDVVVGQGSAIFELLAGEDQSLLVRGNSFLVLNLKEEEALDVLSNILQFGGEAIHPLHHPLFSFPSFHSRVYALASPSCCLAASPPC
jgi:hypothetical protein